MTSDADLHFQEEAELSGLELRAAGRAGAEAALLARAAQDAGAAWPARLAAATELQARGDPRIPAVPEVLPVPGATVEIGLPVTRIDAVVRQWRHVGVERSWIEKEAPAWPAVLDRFWLGRYPVTNSQYAAFLRAAGWPRRPATRYLGAYPWDRPGHPVCGIADADADAYVTWLSEQAGHPYRLPTEAEWEYAAKGPEGREFPWGESFRPDRANTREAGVHTTTPVGVFPSGAGPFGHLDLAGNVEEYTADTYAPYPGGELVDDHLASRLGRYRVTRGGSFARYGDLARTRRRHGAFPGPLYPCGLRIATGRLPSGATS
jgi:toxoflavin biosynthesis protein ToxD